MKINKYIYSALTALTLSGSTTHAHAHEQYNGFGIDTLAEYVFGQQECSPPKTIETVGGETTFRHVRGAGVRCEVAVHNMLKFETDFKIKFDFRIKSHYPNTPLWHSIMQIHSFPDKSLGEKWRCPVMALEVHNGALSMFRRYDTSRLSVPGKWGCADDNPATTIQSVALFRDVPYSTKKWNTFEMSGRLSLSGDECLTVKINDYSTVSCGANMYNDAKQPFVKFGIYRPGGWDFYNSISVTYRDVEFY